MAKLLPGNRVMTFKKSADLHAYLPEFGGASVNVQYLQIALLTTPGQGRFEATVKYFLRTGYFQVCATEISRTNQYDRVPDLDPYCFCKPVL